MDEEHEYPQLGWYNDGTGQWDKDEPDLPAFMADEMNDD